MKTTKIIILLIAVVTIFGTLPSALFAETSNMIVAVVNNNVITLHELNKKIEEVTGVKVDKIKSENENAYIETQKKVLDMLIDEKIAQEKILELGIQVSEDQVDAAIESIRKANNMVPEEFIARLENEGISYERYREIIKIDIERNQLINYEVKSKIIIREEEVFQYYMEHNENYIKEGQVSLAGIFLNKDKFEELSEVVEFIFSEINNGVAFKDLAMKFSSGPGADEGGDLGDFKFSQLDSKLKEVLDKMTVGEVSAPITDEAGVQLIKLLRKEETKMMHFDDVKEGIYNILYKEEVNNRYNSWVEELRKNTYTKINI